MPPDLDSLETQLLTDGYSEEFIDIAMQHEKMFDGDIKIFVDFVSHLIEEQSEHANDDTQSPSTLMDFGSKKVERDWTGDNLTHGGYDFVDQNKRR